MAVPITAVLQLSTTAFSGGLKVAGAGLRLFTGLVKAAAIAVAGLSAGLALLTARQIAFVDRLGKISDTVGLSTDLIQKFGFAAEIAGVSFDQSSVALRRFSRRLGEAKKGVGELRPALREIGLKDAEIRAMSAEQALFALADGIADTEDESKRLALAFKAFDSEGAELVNTLRNGSEGLREMFREFQELGILLDRSSIKQVEELQDSLTKLQAVGTGAANALLISLAPALTELVEGFAEAITKEAKARGGFQKFGQYLKEEFLTILQKIVRTVAALYNIMFDLTMLVINTAKGFGFFRTEADAVKEALEILTDLDFGPQLNFGGVIMDMLQFKTVSEDVKKELEKVLGKDGIIIDDAERLAAIDKLKARLKTIGDDGLFKLGKISEEDLNGLLGVLEKLKGKSTEVAEEINEVVVTGTRGTIHFLDAALNKVFGKDRIDKFFSESQKHAEKATLSIADFIGITFELLLEDIGSFFNNMKEKLRNSGIGDAVKTLEDGFIKAGQLLEDALTDAVLTGKASFSDLADHIKKVLAKALIQKFITGPILGLMGLADGGPAKAGTPYVVGEEGPELFVPNQSGTVIPNDEMTNGGSGLGGTTVNYNINAIDTRSFQERLAENPEFLFNVTRVGSRRQPA